jgi:antitoxin CcdA
MPDIGQAPGSARRATNVTLPENLVAQAKELGINVSQACEAGLAAEVKVAREKKWREENREAIEDLNRYYEDNEPSLTRYRRF